jgi:hypothetical protein
VYVCENANGNLGIATRQYHLDVYGKGKGKGKGKDVPVLN